MTPLLKGLAFGFVLAATVGPMWLLCFRRTLTQGALAGFVSGMGIAVADALYGAVAAFGLTAVSGFLLAQRTWLGLAGAAYLFWLGAKALLAPPQSLDAAAAGATAPASANGAQAARPSDPPSGGTAGASLAAAFGSTLALTLANPPTILAFAAIFAGLGLGANAEYAQAGLVVAGVFLGSAIWWILLALATARLRGRIGRRAARAVNLASGLTILAFAAWQLAIVLR